MITQEYTYVYATVSVSDGALDTLVLQHFNSESMHLILDEAATRHPKNRIAMILDGAGWFKSSA
jgi:hypothetical protein